MLGGNLNCFIFFFSHNLLLLLGVCSRARGANDCTQLNGRAGGTVELSPGTINETLEMARWNYNSVKIADMYTDDTVQQFIGRLSFNKTTFNLTISKLTEKDSGEFTFVSDGEGEVQRPTLCFRLEVHALVGTPVLSVINTTTVSNVSCVVWLQCSTNIKNVSYKWTVDNKTFTGPTLQYSLRPQEGDTVFKCTVSNIVSNSSEIYRLEGCKTPDKPGLKEFLEVVVGTAFFIVIIIIVVVIFVVFCRQRRARSASDADDRTLYAEIEDFSSNKNMKSCSLYETVENIAPTVKPQAQTVYDQIQFSRMAQQ